MFQSLYLEQLGHRPEARGSSLEIFYNLASTSVAFVGRNQWLKECNFLHDFKLTKLIFHIYGIDRCQLAKELQ